MERRGEKRRRTAWRFGGKRGGGVDERIEEKKKRHPKTTIGIAKWVMELQAGKQSDKKGRREK